MLGAAGVVALLTMTAPSAADAPIEAFEARYEVLRNGAPLGEATLSLQRSDDDSWTFVSHTRGTRGLAAVSGAEIREQSSFIWRDGLPELRSYRFRQDVVFRTRKRSLDLVGDDEIQSVDRDRRHSLRFEPGVMDRHVVVLALAARLAAGAEGELRLQVADRDAVQWQRFRIEAVESVLVPAGRRDCVRIERIRDKPGRTTTTWLAPSLRYLPVRTVQRESDGETIEMRLVAVQ